MENIFVHETEDGIVASPKHSKYGPKLNELNNIIYES